MVASHSRGDSHLLEIKRIKQNRPFDQKKLLIKKNNTFIGEPMLNPSGVCEGLVDLWCEYEATDRDLMSELKSYKLAFQRYIYYELLNKIVS